MREKLGYSAYGKFILITALAKVLLVDNSLSVLGGGAFLVPLIALAGGIALIFLLDRNRLRGGLCPADGAAPTWPQRLVMLLFFAAILMEVTANASRMTLTMKHDTFLTTGESTIAAVVLAAMVAGAFFGLTGMDGAGKIGLVLSFIVLILGLWAAYSNYDPFRVLPLVREDWKDYLWAGLQWTMAFWPVALLWVFPQKPSDTPRIKKFGIRGACYGALWGGGILLACLMVRSPYSAQPGFSPVSFLFEQATMGRSFYRLDPILSVAISCMGVVSGALGLYVCGILLKRIVGLPDVRPAVVLMGMACLCAIQWSLTPGSPLWGIGSDVESWSIWFFLGGIVLGLITGRRRAHG